jgi:hypothetical protein
MYIYIYIYIYIYVFVYTCLVSARGPQFDHGGPRPAAAPAPAPAPSPPPPPPLATAGGGGGGKRGGYASPPLPRDLVAGCACAQRARTRAPAARPPWRMAGGSLFGPGGAPAPASLPPRRAPLSRLLWGGGGGLGGHRAIHPHPSFPSLLCLSPLSFYPLLTPQTQTFRLNTVFAQAHFVYAFF